MDKIPDHYCALLHAGLQLRIDQTNNITVNPCGKFTYADSIPVTEDVFHHPKLMSLREQNKKYDILTKYCSKCVYEEGNALSAKTRLMGNNDILTDKLIYDVTGPTYISFSLDYVCNLACVTCGPLLSTKWRGLVHERNFPTAAGEENIRSTIRKINLENVKTVHIFGGETLLTKTNEVILEELSAYGKNITIWYDTNATVYPSEKTIELWQKFHLVRLKLSLDAIGTAFEYLRWPAKWNKTESNIFKMKELLPSNVMFGLRPAIGILNFYLIKELHDWYENNLLTNREGDPTDFEYSPVYGKYCAINMTDEMRDMVPIIYGDTGGIYTVLPPPGMAQHTLTEIRESLDAIDAQRNISWRKMLPHLIPFLDK